MMWRVLTTLMLWVVQVGLLLWLLGWMWLAALPFNKYWDASVVVFDCDRDAELVAALGKIIFWLTTTIIEIKHWTVKNHSVWGGCLDNQGISIGLLRLTVQNCHIRVKWGILEAKVGLIGCLDFGLFSEQLALQMEWL